MTSFIVVSQMRSLDPIGGIALPDTTGSLIQWAILNGEYVSYFEDEHRARAALVSRRERAGVEDNGDVLAKRAVYLSGWIADEGTATAELARLRAELGETKDKLTEESARVEDYDAKLTRAREALHEITTTWVNRLNDAHTDIETALSTLHEQIGDMETEADDGLDDSRRDGDDRL